MVCGLAGSEEGREGRKEGIGVRREEIRRPLILAPFRKDGWHDDISAIHSTEQTRSSFDGILGPLSVLAMPSTAFDSHLLLQARPSYSFARVR